MEREVGHSNMTTSHIAYRRFSVKNEKRRQADSDGVMTFNDELVSMTSSFIRASV
jgi:hypothetical protein